MLQPDAAVHKLCLEYADFARAVACKLAQNLPINQEDAISAGNEGLVQAARRFSFTRYDPRRGPLAANFRSLAYRRIHGAIYDEIRRSSFSKRRGFEKGIHFDMVPLDKTRTSADGDSMPLLDLPVWDEAADLAILAELTEQERHVVTGLAAGYTGLELAKELGIHPVKVTQIKKTARVKMAAYLSED